jgi:hypothetical protein
VDAVADEKRFLPLVGGPRHEGNVDDARAHLCCSRDSSTILVGESDATFKYINT